MKYTTAIISVALLANNVGAFTSPSQNTHSTALHATRVAAEAAVDVVVSSPIMQVFIEDTDAYGMVYNGNYLRAYERALYGFGTGAPSELLSHKDQDWSIVQVNKQRFKQSLLLGENFVISGTRKKETDTEETWDLVMKDITGDIIYNSATVTIASELPSFPPLLTEVDGADVFMEDNFVLHRDEFDISLPHRIPLRAVLNPFERSRSMGLGGPDSLRRLKEEDGIITVVTSIDQAALLENDDALCRPGKAVTATSSVKVLRRGMILKWTHTLWTDDDEGVPHRVAQAIVNLMMLDAHTRKPTSKLPDWVREILSGDASGV